MQQSEKQRRLDELLAQIGRLLVQVAELEPLDIVTLVLALPVDLAGYMQELAQRNGVLLPALYSSVALEGLLHQALHNGRHTDAQRIARMIRRISDDQAWAQFVARHPEVTDGRGDPGG